MSACMDPADPDLVIEHCREIDSTNAELLRRAGLPDRPLWLVAERQTQGRGRRARPWLSTAGQSLTASLALERVRPQGIGPLALVAGVAVAEALAGFGVPVRLKWPNDVHASQRPGGPEAKAGGILCEARARGERTRLVVGVGLNLRAPATDAVDQPVAGLFAGRDVPPMPIVAEAVGRRLASAVLQLLEQGFAPFSARWSDLDLLLGRPIDVHPAGGGPAWPAIAHGIDADGALRVVPDGAAEPVRLLAGEVSVRLQPCAPAHPA